ncbi:hypothetical protein ANO14919_071570 [Xylariales sp. No.14919]|nr:hypothetical protein ANO14919_071570 [Xylariales sp. No.14919]
MTSPKPTVFFSPGGFHTPWVFDTVRGILSGRGFTTEVSSLLSVGGTDPNLGLYSDAEHLRSLLIERIDEGQEIVFVAHSYGGMVISCAVEGLSVEQRAAEGKKGGIVMILYIASLIMSTGQSLQSTIHPSIYPWADGEVSLLL